jgi:hypothetical protein
MEKALKALVVKATGDDAIRIQTGLFPVTVKPRPTFGERRRPWRG